MAQHPALTRMRSLLANPQKGTLARAVRGSVLQQRSRRPLQLEEHLDATYGWLCAAQDSSDDGGVAGWFDLLKGRWTPSYPETTGYIIPTLLALAEARSDPQARERALRMADWESDIQMEDGAVLSSVLGAERGPAVFNTGQALFGWIAALQASGDERYAQSARAAGNWLIENQDDDGAWRKNLSMVTSAPVHTYNNRCAWALAYAATVLGEDRFAQAAHRNSEWALAQQNEAGWFEHTGFTPVDVPLLHTISYVIEGLLGVYAFTAETRYLEAARRALDAMVEVYRAGRLAGCLDSSWRGTVSWRCVTGDAQIAVVLLRLAPSFPDAGYAEVARRLIEDVARMQLRVAPSAPSSDQRAPRRDPAIGAVPGSFPVWGKYMRLAFPNWAAKFYLDALLLEVCGVDEKSFPGLPPR